MKRTTILLPDDLVYLLDRERRRRGVSTTAIVREALAAHFNMSEQPRRLRISGIADSGLSNEGLSDLGENFEYYLEQAWGSDEFFEQTMGRAPTPEEKTAALRHHAIWKPDADDDAVSDRADVSVADSELDESRVSA